jgi:tetratricopeptide (TPR) repeat protein
MLGGCASSGRAVARVDEQIRYYERALEQDPDLYPVHTQLGAAWLERARLTHDPADLEMARAAVDRSLEIQSSFAGFSTMASICNFAHRFEESLEWGGRAVEAAPMETAVTVQLVEAHLMLGRPDAAAALLPPLGKIAPDFNISTARGRWLAAERQTDEAVEAYLMAAEDARTRGETSLDVWARVMAAGVLIDAGRPAEATAILDEAAAIDPDDRGLRRHRAEVAEAEGRHGEALKVYEALLRDADDPTLHAAAFVAATRTGDERRASHFDAARQGLQKAVDAGEVYTLGSLALLYYVAGTNLDEALELARRNVQHTRTEQAYRLLAELEER